MRTPARSLLLVCALAILGAACNQSAVDPDAAVSVAGAFSTEDGKGVGGARVALMKEPDAGDVFVGVVSIGLSCLEYEFSECGETRLATTDDHGGFAYDLKGSDTQGRFDNAAILELSASLDRSEDHLAGPGVSTRFQVQTEQVQIPLRLWEPTLTVDSSGKTVDVGFADPPAGSFPAAADLGDMVRWVVFEASRGQVVWRANARAGGVSFDARVLEDSTGGVSAFATIGDILTDAGSGTDVEVLLRSPKLAYASQAGPPPSRGRPCSTSGGAPVDDCVLTDGDFSVGIGDVEATQATIDLDDEIDVTFVVLRGCSGACVAEGSRDGKTWSRLGSSSDTVGPSDLAFKPKSVRASTVRITAADGISSLREVSVWDAAASGDGSLLTTPSAVSGDLVPGARADGRSSTLLIVALIAALALIVVLVVVLISRGRRTATSG